MDPAPRDFTTPTGRRWLEELGRRSHRTLFYEEDPGSNSGAGATVLTVYSLTNLFQFGGEAVDYDIVGYFNANVNNKTVAVSLDGNSLFSTGAVAFNGGSFVIRGKIIKNYPALAGEVDSVICRCSTTFDYSVPATFASRGVRAQPLTGPGSLTITLTGGATGDIVIDHWRGTFSHAP